MCTQILSDYYINKDIQNTCKKCKFSCNKNAVSPIVLQLLKEAFEKLTISDFDSLLKQYLTEEVFKVLKDKKTAYGSSLLDCIQSGIENIDSPVGIFAPDPLAYFIFYPLFDPIIRATHDAIIDVEYQPSTNWGDCKTFINLDPNKKYIISTTISCSRSIDKYPFHSQLSEDNYLEIEDLIRKAITNLPPKEYKGQYLRYEDIPEKKRKILLKKNLLFNECDKVLAAANVCRYWPKGRGIFINNKKNLAAWINEQDHLKIISTQNNGNFYEVYLKLSKIVSELEGHLRFARHDSYGYLTFSPTLLGTTLLATVQIKLPLLTATAQGDIEEIISNLNLRIINVVKIYPKETKKKGNKKKLDKKKLDKKKLDKTKLDKKRKKGVEKDNGQNEQGKIEDDKQEGGKGNESNDKGDTNEMKQGANPERIPKEVIYEIGNLRKLGVSEYSLMNEYQNGLLELIKLEQQLEPPIKNKKGKGKKGKNKTKKGKKGEEQK